MGKLKRTGEVRYLVAIYLLGGLERKWIPSISVFLNPIQRLRSNLDRKSEDDLREHIDMFGCLPQEVFKHRTVEQAIHDIQQRCFNSFFDYMEEYTHQLSVYFNPQILHAECLCISTNILSNWTHAMSDLLPTM